MSVFQLTLGQVQRSILEFTVNDIKLNKHQKKRQQTQEHLKCITFELIAEQGFDAINVQHIIKHANVARGTFYIHFQNKTEIAWSLLEDKLVLLDTKLKTFDTRKEKERQKKWLYIFIFIAEHKNLFRTLLGEQGHLSLVRQTQHYVAQIIRRDLPHMFPDTDLPVAFSAEFIAGALIQTIIHWLEHPESYTLDELSNLFFKAATKVVLPG